MTTDRTYAGEDYHRLILEGSSRSLVRRQLATGQHVLDPVRARFVGGFVGIEPSDIRAGIGRVAT